MTKREQIMQALVAVLAGTAQVGTRIYRSRVDALSRDEAPALVVMPVGEQIAQDVVSLIEKNMMVEVQVYVRSDVPDVAADPICEEVHQKVMADATLGGLAIDIVEDGTSWDMAEADVSAGFTNMRYRIWYRHNRNSLSA